MEPPARPWRASERGGCPASRRSLSPARQCAPLSRSVSPSIRSCGSLPELRQYAWQCAKIIYQACGLCQCAARVIPPSDANPRDTGCGGHLHIETRVADHHRATRGHAGFRQRGMDHRRVRLGGMMIADLLGDKEPVHVVRLKQLVETAA